MRTTFPDPYVKAFESITDRLLTTDPCGFNLTDAGRGTLNRHLLYAWFNAEDNNMALERMMRHSGEARDAAIQIRNSGAADGRVVFLLESVHIKDEPNLAIGLYADVYSDARGVRLTSTLSSATLPSNSPLETYQDALEITTRFFERPAYDMAIWSRY